MSALVRGGALTAARGTLYLSVASADAARVGRSVERAEPRVGPPRRWLFLGRDYERLVAWESALGPGWRRIGYATDLQELAMRWRRPYLQWIAALGAERNSLAWWTSAIAERNTLLPSLFHLACYLEIGLRHGRGLTPPLLIVAESEALIRTIAESQGLSARPRLVAAFRARRDRWRRAIWRLRGWGAYFVDGYLALRRARRTRRDEALAASGTDRPRVILHTCVDESYFGPNGVPRDRYFGPLAGELRRRGYEVLTMPWLYQIRRSRGEALAWFRQRPAEYVIPEDFYRFSDYVWAARVVRQQRRRWRGRQTFEGLDMTGLVREQCIEQGGHSGIADFVRYARLVKRWARSNVRVDVFIDMFENMAVEKPQVLALRRWMPRTLTVGFQHYIAPEPLHLSKFTTPDEAAIAPHPDVIVCNSEFTAERLASAGFSREKLRVGPSLRYGHLLAPLLDASPERGAVLVVLSLDSSASKEVLFKLLDAFPREEGLRFWLKPHPMMAPFGCRVLLSGRSLPSHMTLVDGPIEDALARACCAVAAATTAALEVALSGVPVVLVGRETDFDINPLAWFPEFDGVAGSVRDLRARILEKARSPDAYERARRWAAEMRPRFVSPLTEAAVAAFVDPLPGAAAVVQTAAPAC